MNMTTWDLINEARRRLNYKYNRIEQVNCDYKVEDNKLIVTPRMIAINGCDVYCKDEEVCTDPLTVYFDKILPKTVTYVDYNPETKELRLNDTIYFIKMYYDIGFFIGDFGCQDAQALESLMKYFGEWLLKGENK